VNRATPIPNLRRAEWLDRLLRQTHEQVRPRNRRRTVKRIVRTLLLALVVGLFKSAWHLSAQRLGWEAPPGRSGERMGADRISK
jgi:hypothetical protein